MSVGRVGAGFIPAPGVCIRLYTEEDFAARPEFTEPEILRTNLASVILQMTAIGLGDVASFPFVEPPDRAAIRDGYLLLEELGAIEAADGDGARRLTPIGRRLARLPVALYPEITPPTVSTASCHSRCQSAQSPWRSSMNASPSFTRMEPSSAESRTRAGAPSTEG